MALKTLNSDPQTFCDRLAVKSIAGNFLNDDSCSIAKMASHLGQYGEFKIKAMLNILVIEAVLFFNVGKTMSEPQVKQTVELIYDDYKHFKPEDFKLCFKNAMKGNYGVMYDRIDGQVILSWLIDFDNERDREIETIRTNQNKDFKKIKATPLLPVAVQTDDEAETARLDEIYTRNMAKLKEAMLANKIAREQAKRVEAPIITDPMYHLHQQWIKQFETLWIKQGSNPGIKIVRKYGTMKNPRYDKNNPVVDKNNPRRIPRMLDINAYLEYKQGQYLKFNDPKIITRHNQ